MVRIRFSQYTLGQFKAGRHLATIARLPQYKRRATEPFDSVDYTSSIRSEKILGWQSDGRFIGKPLLHRRRKHNGR